MKTSLVVLCGLCIALENVKCLFLLDAEPYSGDVSKSFSIMHGCSDACFRFVVFVLSMIYSESAETDL